jgi:hypothetical protein
MMSMGKGRLERYQRLRDVCKRIVANPHSIDDDIKAKLKTATLKYAATQYVDTEQALGRVKGGTIDHARVPSDTPECQARPFADLDHARVPSEAFCRSRSAAKSCTKIR